jgi:hypothetical protein
VELAAEHGATDAPTVDVVARGVATLVDDAAYGDVTAYFSVPPASYILDVTDAAGATTVASFTADLSGLANRAAFVFASGFLTPAQNQNGPAFGLFAALPNGLVIAFPPLVEGPTGTIAGTVVDEATQAPLAGVKIVFFKQNATVPLAGWALTGNNGEYSAVLGTGTYLVKAEPGGMYVPEWFDNVATPAEATPVQVQENQSTTANFALAKIVLPPMVNISGVVTDEGGSPIEGAIVIIMRTIQEMHTLAVTPGAVPGIGSESVMIDNFGQCRGVIWKGVTNAQGEYTASVRGENSYVAVAVKAGYLPEYYDNKPNPTLADVIVVGGDNISGIDFSLAALPNILHSIAGTVQDELGTGVPSRIVLIPVQPASAVGVRFGHTDGNGAYMLTHVLAGDYYVLALPFSGYAPAFYKDGAFGVIHWKDADIVTVSGAVSGIDIGVVTIKHVGLAQLTGKAATTTGTPVEGTNVFATTATGEIVGYGLTDAEGVYTIANVPPGTLTLKASRDGYNSSEATVNIPTNAFATTGDIPMTPASVTDVLPLETTPQTFALHQNYPNPFNPSTSIVVDLPSNSLVRLTIYNVLGQEMVTLVDGLLTAGRTQVVWNGADNAGRPVASGSYYYRLTATTPEGHVVFLQTKTMLLLK